ncbi:MAG: hypothetical protein KDC90_18355, partial [Ignavibacteriae bacterium]|nr:hypothetical protein [Ignavibacteriota bacterium]
MKYFKRPIYYTFLLFKKIKIILHNYLEPHIKVEANVDQSKFEDFLWQNLKNNLSEDVNGIYFNSKVTNKNMPMLLSQARVILILCNNLNSFGSEQESKKVIQEMTNYLISMRDEKGLFKFNQASWDLQDEGIASVWSTLALIRSYEVIKNEEYLKVAVSTMESMLKYL